MFCPVCRDEFEDDVTSCPEDHVALVPETALPEPVTPEAPLGTFHRLTAAPVRRLLEQRGVRVRVVELDDDRHQLWVDGDERDSLRAELTMSWSGYLRMLTPEEQVEVAAGGGDQPGWFDPPRSAWLDDDGRLRVEATPDEEALADAQRTIGPGLVAVGVIMLLLAWIGDGSEGLVFGGIAAIVLGLLLPV